MAEFTNTINSINPKSQIQPLGSRGVTARPTQEEPVAAGLSFSKHLSERISRRQIDLSGEKLNRLAEAVEKVAGKGARDSVVFLDNLALLVSVSKRTVLTAIETEKMKDGVFTNIDSVVVG